MMLDEGFLRPLSLSFSRTSKKIHGKCMGLFWKGVIVDLDNVVENHDTRITWNSGPSSFWPPPYTCPLPRALPWNISKNSKHVTFRIDLIEQSTLCKTLEELADWSQIQRIDLIASTGILRPELWAINGRRRAWWSMAESLFQDGGRLSHVQLNLSIHKYWC
jgi:hypothetical protein